HVRMVTPMFTENKRKDAKRVNIFRKSLMLKGGQPYLTWFHQPRKPAPDPDWFDQCPAWKAPEVPLGDGRILVLES
ncbi:MAG: hypothetical protein NTW21_37645, partial [Verrucomicrobia bacterium]|nr:hypothetical protein [Verrucomicrobiota bacterium]